MAVQSLMAAASPRRIYALPHHKLLMNASGNTGKSPGLLTPTAPNSFKDQDPIMGAPTLQLAAHKTQMISPPSFQWQILHNNV